MTRQREKIDLVFGIYGKDLFLTFFQIQVEKNKK